MQKILDIHMISEKDVDSVTSIYEQVMHPAYMGAGELKEGYSDIPGVPAKQSIHLFKESLISRLNDPKTGMFVACIDNEIVGFAIAILSHTNAGHIECWLEDTGVSQDWRKHGIGKKLVNHVLQWGSSEGAKYFMLEVGVQNINAQRLYEQLGYHPLSIVFWRGQD